MARSASATRPRYCGWCSSGSRRCDLIANHHGQRRRLVAGRRTCAHGAMRCLGRMVTPSAGGWCLTRRSTRTRRYAPATRRTPVAARRLPCIVRRLVRYPFVPKSTAALRPGQYWAVPLSNNRFACCRVIQVGGSGHPTPSREFFGALHKWTGIAPPCDDDVAGLGYFRFGAMHIRAILRTGGEILGERALELDSFEMPTFLSAHGGPSTLVLRGADRLRIARSEDFERYPVLTYWGYNLIRAFAEKHLSHAVA